LILYVFANTVKTFFKFVCVAFDPGSSPGARSGASSLAQASAVFDLHELPVQRKRSFIPVALGSE
jgi:arginase family enzyme